MGCEIRRVPKGWEHPKDLDGNFEPLYDRDYLTELSKWIENHKLWERGEHPDQLKQHLKVNTLRHRFYASWAGDPPSFESYRPAWTEEPTCYQLYEIVSEGTPLSPVFETEDALIDWLVVNGDGWDRALSRKAAEALVRQGSCCSMTTGPDGIKLGAETLV